MILVSHLHSFLSYYVLLQYVLLSFPVCHFPFSSRGIGTAEKVEAIPCHSCCKCIHVTNKSLESRPKIFAVSG